MVNTMIFCFPTRYTDSDTETRHRLLGVGDAGAPSQVRGGEVGQPIGEGQGVAGLGPLVTLGRRGGACYGR